ncbi:MAG: NAD(P)H-dependent oxidoreductase subunit E [Acidimicrobiia bacterium]|nr:NAD(P)H-dependent oxidoreductase subunit E [Acidimicrobiia bacterium]
MKAEPAEAAVDLAAMDDALERLGDREGALIPILQQAQELYGYLPLEVLHLIAAHLGVAAGKVYGVATFYSQFFLDRRGRHILRLCDGTACHVKGTPALITAVSGEFEISPGETSDDGELTVEIVYCMGSCALAPIAVLDGRVMGGMGESLLLDRLAECLEPG